MAARKSTGSAPDNAPEQDAYATLVATLMDASATPRQSDYARAIGMPGKSLRDVSRGFGTYVGKHGHAFDADARSRLLTSGRVRRYVAQTLGIAVDALPPVDAQ